jgi:hypothetical protein
MGTNPGSILLSLIPIAVRYTPALASLSAAARTSQVLSF